MRVVHTVASTNASQGGTSRSIPTLCQSLSDLGVQTELLTTSRSSETDPGQVLLPREPVVVNLVGASGRPVIGWWESVRGFRRVLAERIEVGPSAIVHDHGAWLATNYSSSSIAARLDVPFVISPRGMLTDWAIRHNRIRKQVAWRIYQRRAMERAAMIHVTSEGEAACIRELGLDLPICMVPNGIELPEEDGDSERTGSGRNVLFLSRFHPKKGLPNLIRAWDQVRPAGWILTLVGPDENGHRAEIEGMVRERGLGATVRFREPIDDHAKWDLYRSADLFVLPSHSENFGSVVGEALACGVPVITTRETPWSELGERHCGWWIDVGVEPLARALGEAVGTSVQKRREMGRRGKRLIQDRYSWREVAVKMRAAYSWLVGTGDRPAFVERPCA